MFTHITFEGIKGGDSGQLSVNLCWQAVPFGSCSGIYHGILLHRLPLRMTNVKCELSACSYLITYGKMVCA